MQTDSFSALNEACRLLASGSLVAIPTETVYGLAADATNPSAVAAVFRAKGRPADHPVIVHLGEVDWVEQWAHSLPDGSQGLLRHFWPGPLTVILPRREGVSDAITGGQTTVGLRMPAHPLTLALLRRLGRALVAPSANRFGRISPTTAEHVRSEFGDDVAVLDGGPCRHGLESTILDLSGAAARILRPGPITFAELARFVRLEESQAKAPRVPGSLASHYAPRTPTFLVTSARLGQIDDDAAVLTWSQSARSHRWRALGDEPQAYGRGLYQALRELDALQASVLLVEGVPTGPAWEAIADRIGRACQGELTT